MAGTELVYDPNAGLGPLDRIMIQGAAAHKSPNEISAMTRGRVPAEVVVNRVMEILDTRDWLSQVHMKMLLVDDMMRVKDQLMNSVLEFKDKDNYRPLISILTLLEKTLAAEKVDLKKAMEQISKAHAQVMLAGISLALERTHLELEKRYPNIARSELLEIFNASLPAVVKEIESHVE